MKPEYSDALIVVDMQNDFLPGGALAVEEGAEIIPAINKLLPVFSHRVFTRDWHPPDDVSFSDEPEFKDMSWPPHCVQNTPGAEFHSDLQLPADALVISKGQDPDEEAYSGFQGTNLAEQLTQLGVKRVFVTGVATNFCVKFTVLDALRHGFTALLVADATRGIDQPAGAVQQAIDEMKEAGAELIQSGDVE